MKVRQAVFDTYWKTAAERQEIFFRRLNNTPGPLTADPIFKNFKFCNVYRAADRVSQFLIKEVIYKGTFSPHETLFRIFLFRLLNRPETWVELEKIVGEISLRQFSFQKYDQIFEKLKKDIGVIYGNAFILCANKVFGFDKKHQNHLALLENVFQRSKLAERLLESTSLKELFHNLLNLPLIGDFMAYQIAIDFNYAPVFNFDENDFTIAGPGAVRGINKCFLDTDGKSSEYIIKFMVDRQEEEFKRLGLKFRNLFGRPMHAIDCQGWFCETDKYCRVAFPELKSNRVKMKAAFKPSLTKIAYFFPPKWHLNYPGT